MPTDFLSNYKIRLMKPEDLRLALTWAAKDAMLTNYALATLFTISESGNLSATLWAFHECANCPLTHN